MSRKFNFISFLVLGVSLLLNVSLQTGSVSAQTAPTCSDSDVVMNVEPGKFLVVAPAGQNWGVTQLEPVGVTIPAGTYNLKYVSFDNHSTDGDHGQNEEQWYYEAFYDGSLVYTSSISPDVPADKDYIFGMLDSNVTLPAIDQIVIKHKLTVDTVGTLPQSVYPVCLSFDAVEPEVVPVTCVLPQVYDEPTKSCKTPTTSGNTGVLGDSTSNQFVAPTPTPTPKATAAVLGASTTATLADTGSNTAVSIIMSVFFIVTVLGLWVSAKLGDSTPNL